MKWITFPSVASWFRPREGERMSAILGYFAPELVTAFILYVALQLIDSYFVCRIDDTSYVVQGYTNHLLHLITKLAEGFSVGMVVICGQYNGIGEHKKIGQAVSDVFWVTAFTGMCMGVALYAIAYGVFMFYEVSPQISDVGIPYLRLRALGVFFNFVYFGLVGFLRGIKNTYVPMYLFLMGAVVYIFFDYSLIFGRNGFACMSINGSAWASVIQYGVMLTGALIYVLTDKEVRPYGINLFARINVRNVIKLIQLSWPVMIDKASLALCNIWLSKMISHVAGSGVGGELLRPSFLALKDLERCALVPGLACAQIITFLVSNNYRSKNWSAISANIYKVLFLSASSMAVILSIVNIWPYAFLSIFDHKGVYSEFAISIVPMVSVLLFLDLLQLITSAALRGAAHVQTVMLVRIIIGLFYFVPVSYFFATMPVDDARLKFVLIYGSLLIGHGLMAAIFIQRLYLASKVLKEST